MMRTAALLASWVVLAVAMLTGCGDGDSSQQADTGGQTPATESPYAAGTTTTTTQPPGPEIVVTDFAFAVPPSVKPDEKITIRNNADGAHSVTSDATNLFDVRISGGGGISTLTAPTAPGAYPFHCKYHANMHGSLTVQ